MLSEPQRAVAQLLDGMPPEVLKEFVAIWVGGFLISRRSKREVREFFAGCDEMASRMLASAPLIRPARAAAKKAADRRKAVEAYKGARSELEAII